MARPEPSNLRLAFDAENFDSPAFSGESRTPDEEASSRARLNSIKQAIARMEEESRAAAAEQSRALAASHPKPAVARFEPAVPAIKPVADSQLAAPASAAQN